MNDRRPPPGAARFAVVATLPLRGKDKKKSAGRLCWDGGREPSGAGPAVVPRGHRRGGGTNATSIGFLVHDLFRKPVPTFRDHALATYERSKRFSCAATARNSAASWRGSTPSAAMTARTSGSASASVRLGSYPQGFMGDLLCCRPAGGGFNDGRDSCRTPCGPPR